LSNTPQRIAAGEVRELHTITAHNPSVVSGAYVKIYALAGTTAPDGSAVPIWSGWVGPGIAGSGGTGSTLAVFIGGANFWIAVATEAGAGLSAPATAFQVSIVTAP
jgi:hypothetical protein